jgi:hypothetical protein
VNFKQIFDHTCTARLIIRPPCQILQNNSIWAISLANLTGYGKHRVSQEERSTFWEVTVSVTVSEKIYMYMCPIPNGFRDTAISLYSSKTVDKKDILRIVYNTGIYYSSDEVATVYLV